MYNEIIVILNYAQNISVLNQLRETILLHEVQFTKEEQ